MAEVDLTPYNIEHKRIESFFTPIKPIPEDRLQWAEASGFVISAKPDGRIKIFGGDEDERVEAITKLVDESIPLDIPKGDESSDSYGYDSSDSDDILLRFGKTAMPKDELTEKEKEELRIKRQKEILEHRAQQAIAIPKIVKGTYSQPQPITTAQPRKPAVPEKKKLVFKPIKTDIKSVGWGEVKVKPDVIVEKPPEVAPPPPPRRKPRYTHSSDDEDEADLPVRVRCNYGSAYSALRIVFGDGRMGPSAHDKNYERKSAPIPRKFKQQPPEKFREMIEKSIEEAKKLKKKQKKEKKKQEKKEKKQQQLEAEKQEQQQQKKEKKNKKDAADDKFKPYVKKDEPKKLEIKPAPKPEPKPEPKPAPKPTPKPTPKPAPKPAPKPKPKKIQNKFGIGVAEEVVEIPLEEQVPDMFVKPKVIEDDLRRSLYFAFDSYKDSMTDEEIRNKPEYKMTLRNEGSLKPCIAAVRNIACPPLTADFIIECFSKTMPKEQTGVANKCTNAPTAHRLLLPSMLPVSFTLADDKVYMAFFDTPGVCAVEAETIVRAAIDNFQNRDVTTYTFSKVGSGIVTPAKVALLAKECGTVAVMSKPVGTNNCVSYTISVMKVRWNSAKETAFDTQIHKWFEELKLVDCKLCKKSYHIGDDSVCQERYHPGERQELESGEMEILMTVNDEEKHKVSYTCCGECFLEDPGCKVRINEKHIPGEVISTLKVETDKIL